MTTITIPKETAKEKELVAIPRREYEKYLHLRKIIPVVKMTAAEKKSWARAKKEYAESKYVTLEEVQHELGLVSKRKS